MISLFERRTEHSIEETFQIIIEENNRKRKDFIVRMKAQPIIKLKKYLSLIHSRT